MRNVVVDFTRASSPRVPWTREDHLRIEAVLASVTEGLRHAVEQATGTAGDKGAAA